MVPEFLQGDVLFQPVLVVAGTDGDEDEGEQARGADRVDLDGAKDLPHSVGTDSAGCTPATQKERKGQAVNKSTDRPTLLTARHESLHRRSTFHLAMTTTAPHDNYVSSLPALESE